MFLLYIKNPRLAVYVSLFRVIFLFALQVIGCIESVVFSTLLHKNPFFRRQFVCENTGFVSASFILIMEFQKVYDVRLA